MHRLIALLALLAVAGLQFASAVAAPSDPGSVSFVVTDAKGNAIEGAEVGVLTDWHALPAVTDAAGMAVIEDVPEGEWTAWAVAEGFAGHERDVTIPVTGEALEASEPTVVRIQRGALVTGRLTDPKGRPLAGRRLEFMGPPELVENDVERDTGRLRASVSFLSMVIASTNTDADGRFEVRVPTGKCEVRDSVGRGDTLAKLDLEEGAHEKLTLVLR